MVYETALAECARENLRLELRIAPSGEGVEVEKKLRPPPLEAALVSSVRLVNG